MEGSLIPERLIGMAKNITLRIEDPATRVGRGFNYGVNSPFEKNDLTGEPLAEKT